MELFHFDIETSGNHPDFKTFEQSDPRGSDLFKSKYIKLDWGSKYGSIDEAYLQNAGIISTYGKICCISFGFEDGNNKRISSFYGDDEKDIVIQFNNLLKRIEKKNFILSGFRILHFDIPWILHKLHKYVIDPANIIYLYDKKPWECRMVDLSDDWKTKFAWAFSFDEVCYELNIPSPKDKMNGSVVHKYYWEGRYDEIKKYCEKDVEASIEVGKIIYK